jgi:hypothetical protein
LISTFAVAFSLVFACGGDRGAVQVSVSAVIIEPAAPVTVRATNVSETDDGLLQHGVLVEWRGSTGGRLDDARFAHQVEGPRGDLVTAGRGCGADWDARQRQVVHLCTADFQIIDLQPGETHEYPVRIYPRIGPLRLARGTYVLNEVISWWRPDDYDRPAGRFTVRLTYEVK